MSQGSPSPASRGIPLSATSSNDVMKPSTRAQGEDFLKAAGNGEYDAMEALIALGIDLNLREEQGFGRTAPIKPAATGRSWWSGFFLKKKPGWSSQTPPTTQRCHMPACNGYMDIVALLLEHDADPKQRNKAG